MKHYHKKDKLIVESKMKHHRRKAYIIVENETSSWKMKQRRRQDVVEKIR